MGVASRAERALYVSLDSAPILFVLILKIPSKEIQIVLGCALVSIVVWWLVYSLQRLMAKRDNPGEP